jgi:hypothetical protein
MSKGPGVVENRIAELLAAIGGANLSITERFSTNPSRALSVAEIADYAFALNGRPASREQRLSATRAAHRLVRRIKESDARVDQLLNEADREDGPLCGICASKSRSAISARSKRNCVSRKPADRDIRYTIERGAPGRAHAASVLRA